MIIEIFLIGSIIVNGIGIIVVREFNKQADTVIEQSLLIESQEKKEESANLVTEYQSSSRSRICIEINGKKVVDIEDCDDL